VAVRSPAQTLIDLARTESAEQLTVALDSGLRDGKFNKSLVHRRIVALRPRGRFGVPRLIDAIEGSDARRWPPRAGRLPVPRFAAARAE